MAAATHLAQPERTQQIGLLMQGWFGGTLLGSGDSDPIFHSNVVLGRVQPNWIAVGIEGCTMRSNRLSGATAPMPSASFSVPAAARSRFRVAGTTDDGDDL